MPTHVVYHEMTMACQAVNEDQMWRIHSRLQ